MTIVEARDVATVPSEERGGVLSRTYRALSIGIVSVVVVIAFEATAVGTAMPVAARELGGVGLYAFAFSKAASFTTDSSGSGQRERGRSFTR